MTLKPETLEQILFDRSLGELAPDVEALLRAYLEDRPQADRLADEAEQTVELARRALETGSETGATDLPPPSFLRGGGLARQARRRPRLWFGAISAAAMIVLAFWLGTQNSGPSLANKTQQRIGQPEPQRRMTTGTTSGFWSVARLHQSLSHSASQNHGTLQWRGPLARPQIGEQS